MGQSSEFLRAAQEFLGNYPQWIYEHTNNYTDRIPTSSGKRRVVIIDAPSWLFQRRSYRPDGVYAESLEELYEVMCERLQFYLNDPSVLGVVFMMDKSAPVAKQAKSERQPDSQTPKTPLQLLKSSTGSRREIGERAWQAWFREHPVRTSTDLRSSDHTGTGKQDNYRLPDKKPNANEEITMFLEKHPRSTHQQIFEAVSCKQKGTVTRALKSGNLFESFRNENNEEVYSVSPNSTMRGIAYRQPYWENCLENKDFKRYIYKVVCQGVARKLTVPPRSRSDEAEKFALILGPDYGVKVKATGRSAPHPLFTIPYHEADICVGYWAKYFNGEGYDTQIESIDADVIIASLIGTNARIFRAQKTIDTVEFKANTFVVQNRWETYAKTRIIDVNLMWVAIQKRFTSLAQLREFTIPNPIGVYALLSFALGTDYVRSLPQIGTKSLVAGFFGKCDYIFREGPLVTSHCDEEREFSVDIDSLRVLIAASYNARFALSLDLSDMKSAWKAITAPGSKPVKAKFSEELFNVFHANLTWCLRYYNNATSAKGPPDAFLKDENEVSVFGFELLDGDFDEYGAHRVAFAENARCVKSK